MDSSMPPATSRTSSDEMSAGGAPSEGAVFEKMNGSRRLPQGTLVELPIRPGVQIPGALSSMSTPGSTELTCQSDWLAPSSWSTRA